MLWLVGLLLVVLLVAFTAGGSLVGWGFALILVGLVATYISYSIRVVPIANKANVTRLGKRTRRTLDEGLVFIIPFIEDLLLEDFRTRTEEYSFTARSLDDAEIAPKLRVTWKPSKDHFGTYIDNRSEAGVKEILKGLSESETRQYISVTKWHKVKSSRDAIENLLRERIEKEIPYIDITVLSVMDADLVPGTEIAKTADLAAREEVERRSMTYEMQTIVRLARAMKKASAKRGEPIVITEGDLRFLMTREAIREGRGQYHESDSLAKIAEALLDQLLAQRRQKETNDA